MVAGVKLLTAPEQEGKLTPEAVARLIARVGRRARRAARPAHDLAVAPSSAPSTRSASCGPWCELAHSHGLLVHVDGARLSNAAAALGLPLRALTTDVGVDLVSFGGTKNGLLGGEAVVILRPGLADGLYLISQAVAAAGLQDALFGRPVSGPAGGRSVAALRLARQCDGGQARRMS